MNIGLKEKFNELSMLEDFMAQFKQNFSAGAGLPWWQKAKFIKAVLMQPENPPYTAIIHGRFLAAKNKGPESIGYEAAIPLYESFLKNADRNLNILIEVSGVNSLKVAVPEVLFREKLLENARKHKLTSIEKMLG